MNIYRCVSGGLMILLRKAFFAYIVYSTVLVSPVFPANTSAYLEKTGDKKVKFTWTVRREGNNDVMVSQKAGYTDTYVLNADGGTITWKRSNPEKKTDFIARRNGNTIYLTGTREGREINSSILTDGGIWYQHIAYCLSRFAVSSGRQVSFFVLRPDNFKLLGMNAVKDGIHDVTLDGIVTRVRKVKVTLRGMLSRFWSGMYWYDGADGFFLRYEGVNGPPGTPGTVIRKLTPAR